MENCRFNSITIETDIKFLKPIKKHFPKELNSLIKEFPPALLPNNAENEEYNNELKNLYFLVFHNEAAQFSWPVLKKFEENIEIQAIELKFLFPLFSLSYEDLKKQIAKLSSSRFEIKYEEKNPYLAVIFMRDQQSGNYYKWFFNKPRREFSLEFSLNGDLYYEMLDIAAESVDEGIFVVKKLIKEDLGEFSKEIQFIEFVLKSFE